MNLKCSDILEAAGLTKFRQNGEQVLFRCPNHEDSHPSLSVNNRKNVWMCGPCGASGGPWKLAAFLAGHNPADKASVSAWLGQRGLLEGSNKPRKKIAKTYPYMDERGRLLFEVVRFEPKGFAQRRPNGAGGWIWTLNSVRLVPYRLPDWIKRDTVFIVEGEKDADALWQLDIPATTNPMGAGKWRAYFNQYFVGKQVVIIPDNDEAGRFHARDVAQNLFPVAKTIKMITLPNLPPKGDFSKWLENEKYAPSSMKS